MLSYHIMKLINKINHAYKVWFKLYKNKCFKSIEFCMPKYIITFEYKTKGICMNKEEIIEGLNDKQQEAVLATEGPCLVIAGAGSGKQKY